LLMLLWVLAADSTAGADGTVPYDENELRFRLRLPKFKLSSLSVLINKGFLNHDASTCKHLQADDNICAPETETETETETYKKETETETKYSSNFEIFWKKFKGRWNPEKGGSGGYVKVGKFEASEEFEKLTEQQQQKAIAVADCVSGKYTPDACRWLKRRMFDDFPNRKEPK